MEYLEKSDIILINRLTISRHGGHFVPPFNLLNEGSLDYLLDAVNSEIYGQELYQTISEKAGLYIFSIVDSHVFRDGNKRTGLESGLLFLKLNGYELVSELQQITNSEGRIYPKIGENSNDILYHFIMEIASGEISQEECQFWIEKNIKKS